MPMLLKGKLAGDDDVDEENAAMPAVIRHLLEGIAHK